MKIRNYLIATAAFLLALAAAPKAMWADAVTYDFNGTLTDGNTVTAEFTLDNTITSSPPITQFDFTVPGGWSITSSSWGSVVALGTDPALGRDFTLIAFTFSSTENLVLWFPGSFASFDGGPILTDFVPSGVTADPDLGVPSLWQCVNFISFCPTAAPGTLFTSGSAVPVSATSTPEPSVLLQTGAGLLIGFAVIAFWGKQSFSGARA